MVNLLILLFLNDYEVICVVVFMWFIMLYCKVFRKVLVFNDGIFFVFFKIFFDLVEIVVIKDL